MRTVIDGDTVVLDTGHTVRLLLVDTPETTGPDDDCYGSEAARFAAALVGGLEVALEYDEASCTDRYGRTLAFVATPAGELNSRLVREGYACHLFVPPAGAARAEEFATYEAMARMERVGMWRQCTRVRCDGCFIP